MLISQYAQSVNLIALLGGLIEVTQEELVQQFFELEEQISIESATGVWLDLYRRTPWFVPDQIGFTARFACILVLELESERSSFDEGPFRSSQDRILSCLTPIGDNWYRSILKGLALSLRTGASITDIEAVCRVMFVGGGYVSEDVANGQITVSVSDRYEQGFITYEPYNRSISFRNRPVYHW